jgi:hypothetical protein
LLRHGRRAAEADLPPEPREVEPQVEILGQTVGPRGAAERAQRRQTRELAVSSEADGTDPVAGCLRELAEPHELEVLAAGNQAVPRVADDHAHLHAPDRGIAEEARHVAQSSAFELPVGVDHADHHVLGVEALHQRVAAGEHLVHHAIALVQDGALPAPCLLDGPLHDAHEAGGLERARPAGGVVGRAVVHDDDAEALVVQVDETLERGRDDGHLVVRRDDQRHRRRRPPTWVAPRRQAGGESEQRHVVERDQRHEVPEPRHVDLQHQRGPGIQRKWPWVTTRASTGRASPPQSRRLASVFRSSPSA